MMRPARSARKCNSRTRDACMRVYVRVCARDRACAIAVLSPRGNHPPARARAARGAHAELDTAWLHRAARGRGTRRAKGGGGGRSGIEGWETRGENASATARILTRVARGPNSVTMRAARGIPRNTRNTSSSQKTNEMTRPTHRRARVRLHTNTHTHTCTRVHVYAPSSPPNSLIP